MGESERYSFSLTTFSPSGKLVQIEYALTAVANGSPSVGIRAANGCVIAAEKKMKSWLQECDTIRKIEPITPLIGMVYSGMGPDYRLILKKARKIAQEYLFVYHEEIPVHRLVQGVSAVMQEYTQSGGVRPFGVSLLVAGWSDGRPYLYQCDPSGAYFPWKATALGKHFASLKTFLEKRYNDELETDDAVHVALLTLKEQFDGQMDSDNVEVGIADQNGFRLLTAAELKDYLQQIP